MILLRKPVSTFPEHALARTPKRSVHRLAQPAMTGVFVETRMPRLRDGDLRRRHRQIEMRNSQAERGRGLRDRERYRGDDVGRRGCEHRRMKARNNKTHLPR